MSKSNKELAAELTIAYLASYGELAKGPNSYRLDPIKAKDATALLAAFKKKLDEFDTENEQEA